MTAAAQPPFDSVESAVAEIAAGRAVIVADDERRENEGDLIMAASKVTPETVNLMIRHGSGIVCVPTFEHQLRRLGLGPMVASNRESHRTDFTVSVDAAEGITTGISAYDRTQTIRILADPQARPEQLVQPGHMFPLRARPGGVLERAGHTEAAVDLAVLAGQPPVGVICELVNDDGTVRRLPQLVEFKQQFGLKMISIAALIEYRARRDHLVDLVTAQPFPSEFGEFTLHVFRSRLDGRHHLALALGAPGPEPTLVRVHSGNRLSDVFRGKGWTSHQDLQSSLAAVAHAGRGDVTKKAPLRSEVRFKTSAFRRVVAPLLPASSDHRPEVAPLERPVFHIEPQVALLRVGPVAVAAAADEQRPDLPLEIDGGRSIGSRCRRRLA
jgi:3,4-dihydroxy 2-butanone 4-phosphate synthase/GTP cyclohydrolase II